METPYLRTLIKVVRESVPNDNNNQRDMIKSAEKELKDLKKIIKMQGDALKNAKIKIDAFIKKELY